MANRKAGEPVLIVLLREKRHAVTTISAEEFGQPDEKDALAAPSQQKLRYARLCIECINDLRKMAPIGRMNEEW